MKLRVRKEFSIWLLVTMFIVGCSPLVIIPSEIDMPIILNEETISITAPEGWNSFTVGETISLFIHNVSNDRIVFENDLGVKIYSLTVFGWNKLNNKVRYENTDNIILDPLNAYTLVIKPDISNPSNREFLRIFVVGKIQNDENEIVEGQPFTTYIDIQMEP